MPFYARSPASKFLSPAANIWVYRRFRSHTANRRCPRAVLLRLSVPNTDSEWMPLIDGTNPRPQHRFILLLGMSGDAFRWLLDLLFPLLLCLFRTKGLLLEWTRTPGFPTIFIGHSCVFALLQPNSEQSPSPDLLCNRNQISAILTLIANS